MRFVSSLPPVSMSPTTRQVGALTRIDAVKPISSGDQAVPTVGQQAPRQETTPLVKQQYQRAEPFEDRRKICRRVSQQPVLVELRSGPDRRRHNMRADDLVDHIDETV